MDDLQGAGEEGGQERDGGGRPDLWTEEAKAPMRSEHDPPGMLLPPSSTLAVLL